MKNNLIMILIFSGFLIQGCTSEVSIARRDLQQHLDKEREGDKMYLGKTLGSLEVAGLIYNNEEYKVENVTLGKDGSCVSKIKAVYVHETSIGTVNLLYSIAASETAKTNLSISQAEVFLQKNDKAAKLSESLIGRKFVNFDKLLKKESVSFDVQCIPTRRGYTFVNLSLRPQK